MSKLTKKQLLRMIVEAQDKLSEAYEIINDTGDYSCHELDECATLVQQALRKITNSYHTAYDKPDIEYYFRLQMDHLA
jgi:hypothetical protein